MISHGKTERKAARDARLSAALRENLKRRKTQARGRKADEADTINAQSERQTPDFRRNRGNE